MLKIDTVENNDNATYVANAATTVSHDITVNNPADSARPERERESIDASIHASTVRAKVGYFALYVGLSSSPYYGLLLESKGFSPIAVGITIACMPLCTLVLLPPLSFVVDRYHCALVVHLCAAVGSALLFTLATVLHSHLFIAVTMVMHFAFRTPVGPFMDQRALSILPPDRKVKWGAMRSFGAYGWAAGAFLNSLLNEWKAPWTFGFTYTMGMCVAMYTVCGLISHDETQRTTMNYAGVLRYVASHRRLLLFLAALCFMGLGYSVINTFLFIFLSSINAPSILLGISVVMNVIVEIPIFRCSEYIHRHVTDRQLLCLSMWVWVFRVVGYSLLHNPWMVLFLEPLHGLTFGLMWLSGIHFVRRAFPDSLSCSSVGFLNATAFGVGPLMGNIVGGTLYELLGSRWMFRIMALFMLSISALFVVLDRFLERLGYMEGAVEDVCLENTQTLAPAPLNPRKRDPLPGATAETPALEEENKDASEGIDILTDDDMLTTR